MTTTTLTDTEKLAVLERIFSCAFATQPGNKVTYCYQEGTDVVYLLVPDENEANYLRTLANQS